MTTKIKFSDPRITKTVELPSFECSQVEIYTSLTVGDQRNILAKFPNSQSGDISEAFSASIEMIASAIKSWNFTDENEKDLPVTAEILSQFPEADLTVLIEIVTGKKLSNADNSNNGIDLKKKL